MPKRKQHTSSSSGRNESKNPNAQASGDRLQSKEDDGMTNMLSLSHGTRPSEHNTSAVDHTHKPRSVDQSVSIPSFVNTQPERAWTCVIRSCSPSLRAQNKCVYGTSDCCFTEDLNREPCGGAVRAPGNAGDKRVKRKRAGLLPQPQLGSSAGT